MYPRSLGRYCVEALRVKLLQRFQASYLEPKLAHEEAVRFVRLNSDVIVRFVMVMSEECTVILLTIIKPCMNKGRQISWSLDGNMSTRYCIDLTFH